MTARAQAEPAGPATGTLARPVRRSLVILAGAAVLAPGAACGTSPRERGSAVRPPTPIVVTAAIDDDGVRVSPRRFGAGPIDLIATNLSGRARVLTLATDEIGGPTGGIEQSTGEIGPGDTARLQADLRCGRYAVTVDRGRGAALRVGAPRPSAQDELMQP